MKTFIYRTALLLSVMITQQATAQQFWQKLSLPSTAEMAAKFKAYPSVYAETVTWGWEGNINREIIAANLDSMYSHGFRAATIEAGYNTPAEYLSPGWFELVKIAVEEAKKRDMHLWIIDEGKYPSGFAGGKFSKEKPALRMQGLVVSGRVTLKEGDSINYKLPDGVISAIAINQAGQSNQVIDVSSGNIDWKAPAGNWQVLLIQHRFKTSVTRAANNPTHGKDTVNSLCDYLNPDATRQFLEFTHVQYKKYIGDEFGKTVLGFRGDEPDYGFTPWTPRLPEEFKKRKGYDIVPSLGVIFARQLTTAQKRMKADYWDVWSDMFRENFFDVQADWCAANGLEYMVHLNHEEKMMELVRSEGDFFRDMRHVGIPGVDAIWLQIWPDKVADYPKLASSAAHMYGRPRALSESFAAYTIPPSVPQAKWVIDYEMIRGISLFEYMFWPISDKNVPRGYLGRQEFIPVAHYSNRASYLLANGIPAAQVALYHPTSNMWMGDSAANKSVLDIAQALSEHQIDYDFVDDQGLSSVFTPEKGGFKNLSGQVYGTVIIPSIDYIPQTVLTRLEAFAASGGKLLFMGRVPSMAVGKTFLDAVAIPAIKEGYKEASGQLTPAVIDALSKPDVKLEKAIPGIKYLHRRWKDADLYFFFNESDQEQTATATLSGKGRAEIWDAFTGDIKPVQISNATDGTVQLPLHLDAHETKFIVIHHPLK
ncbi:MAG TPA: glycosyl hydrolase [Chitinophagaceae bacterium]